jgi:hypothetical protein
VNFLRPLSYIAPGKIRGAQEVCTLQPAEHSAARKEKSPALPGFDEFLFRSVHFASLAI